MASLTAFTGNVPQNYDAYLGPLFFEPYPVDLANRLKNHRYQNVLELACGTGRVTKHLLQKLLPNGQLVATDLNNAMLVVAREAVPDERIQWQAADAQALPFNDESFDLVVCQYGVMFFPDKAKAFKEAHRVLQKGGRFLFNTWGEIEYNDLAFVANNVLKEFYPDGAGSFMKNGPHSFFNKEEITRLLTDAGFEKILIQTLSLSSAAATVEEGVNGIVDGTPLSTFLLERSADRQRIKDRLREELENRYGKTNLTLPMRALVCSATKAL